MGIESSLPLIKITRKWSDRKKKVEIPLFRGYVFVKIDVGRDKLNILQTDGVVKFIGIKKKPSRIPDKDIHWMKMLPGNVINEGNFKIYQMILKN